ncbi:MAG: citrate synthase, partial [Halococcoides sp.]
MTDELAKGLEDVLVTESSLAFIDGEAGALRYRGYPIDVLARNASYEETLYLLWEGSLPTESELATFRERMVAERSVDPGVIETVRELAAREENPMAALRTAVSMLSAYDPENGDQSAVEADRTLKMGRRITAKMPTIVAAYKRLRGGNEPVEPREDLDHAANFLYMLDGEVPDQTLADVFDMALVVHADHGINASTFAAMVTVSTESDVYSGVTSAIGTLKGDLHGGANQNVMAMLQEIDESDLSAVEWAREALEGGRRIPGFGHRVYDVKDPRAKILSAKSKALGNAAGELKWYSYSRAIEEFMNKEVGIAPNVDFYSASMYYEMGIPIDIYTPIFAMSRVGGWVANVLEYLDENRLIRPRARYVGPDEQTF